MDYRLYRPENFAALYAIEEACFPPPFRFSRAYMRQLTESEDTATWIAGDETGMAGFAIVEWTEAPDAVAYIQTIEVASHRRRLGIGGELLRRVEQSAQEAGATALWLHVDAGNAAAIRLYESRGYVCSGREPHYYARGRAALIYAKPLGMASAEG